MQLNHYNIFIRKQDKKCMYKPRLKEQKLKSDTWKLKFSWVTRLIFYNLSYYEIFQNRE